MLGGNSRQVESGINSDVNRIGGTPRSHAERVLAKCQSSCVRTDVPLVCRCRSPISMFRVRVTSQSRIFYKEARIESPKKHAGWSLATVIFQTDSLDRPDSRRVYFRNGVGRPMPTFHRDGKEGHQAEKRAQTAVKTAKQRAYAHFLAYPPKARPAKPQSRTHILTLNPQKAACCQAAHLLLQLGSNQ